MMTTLFNSIIPAAIAIATVFLFGCTGEIIMEKAGHAQEWVQLPEHVAVESLLS